jgi:hypothetical protein
MQTKIITSEPGLLVIEMSSPVPYRNIDGDLTLNVQWSDDDACYVARYADRDLTSAIGVGDTVQDALACLCGALRCEVSFWKEEARRQGVQHGE